MFKNNPSKMISMIIFPAADSLRKVDSNYVYGTIDAKNFILGKIENSKYSTQFVDRVSKQLQDILDTYGISIDEHKSNIINKYIN